MRITANLVFIDENNLNSFFAEVAKICKHSFSTCMKSGNNSYVKRLIIIVDM
jgi:hypothetical protein